MQREGVGERQADRERGLGKDRQTDREGVEEREGGIVIENE